MGQSDHLDGNAVTLLSHYFYFIVIMRRDTALPNLGCGFQPARFEAMSHLIPIEETC